MIYTFGSMQDGKDRTVDTDSVEFTRPVAWLADQAGLTYPTVRDYLNVSPNVAGSDVATGQSLTHFGMVEFEKDGRRASVEVRAFVQGINLAENLQGALAWLNIELGLGITPEAIEHMVYMPPVAPEPQQDWQAKDSPMVEPLPGQPGRFKSKSTGKAIGSIWQGPSGASYKLTNIGGIFQYLAWVRL